MNTHALINSAYFQYLIYLNDEMERMISKYNGKWKMKNKKHLCVKVK